MNARDDNIIAIIRSMTTIPSTIRTDERINSACFDKYVYQNIPNAINGMINTRNKTINLLVNILGISRISSY